MSTPPPAPPDFTKEDTSYKAVASVPKTNVVGKSAHFNRIRELREKWCELDTQWWEEAEGSKKRKELEERMSKVTEELKELQDNTYTTKGLKATCKTPSAIFPGKVMGGLKTRRRKHRNGSTRIQRHRASRVSRRKRQTRRA